MKIVRDCRTTHEVLDHHLQSFGEGLASMKSDYGENAVVLHSERSYVGSNEIGEFLAYLWGRLGPEPWRAFRIKRQVVEGEVAFVVWEAKPHLTVVSSTLLIKAGMIAAQTLTTFEEGLQAGPWRGGV